MTWYDEMLKQREEADRDRQYKTALNMLKMNLSTEIIAKALELTMEQVKKIAKDNGIKTA